MLYPPSYIAHEGQQKAEKQQNDAKETQTTSYETLALSLARSQPKLYAEVKKLNAGENSFFEFTEKKLDEHIRYARAHGRELHSEPVSKLTMSYGGNFEIHLINGSAEKDLVYYYDNELSADQNQKQLHKLMDSNEDEMVKYLTTRIQQKRVETEHLAKREVIHSTTEGLNGEQREQAMYGLGFMEKLVNSLKSQVGDQKLNTGDKALVELQKIIKDMMYTVKHTKSLDIHKAISLLSKQYASFIAQNGGGAVLVDKYVPEFTDIINGPKNNTIQAIRKLGNATTMLDNAATTFLRDEIINNGDGDNTNSIKIKDQEFNMCFKNIKKNFELTGDPDKDAKIKENIDALYTKTGLGAQGMLDVLIKKGLVPKGTTLADKDIKQGCEGLFQMITEKQKALNSMEQLRPEKAKTMIAEKLATLQQQASHTEAELILMQQYELMLDNANNDLLNGWIKITNQSTKDAITYGGIAGFLQSGLTGWLAKKGGGFTGTNADILNDSYGTSGKRRDFKDETVVMIKDGAKMLV